MAIDWNELFALSVSPVELIVRGTAVYWFLVILFRVFLRRDVGSIGLADVLLLVLIADAAQNAMAGDYRSITDGAILVSTIVGWNMGINWLTYQAPSLRRLLQPEALCLVQNGHVVQKNLRKELITEDDLRAKLREHGIDDIGQVRAAFMERDGNISVLKR